MRKAKIDIGIYDNEYKLHLVNDVVISEKSNLTIVEEFRLDTLKGVPVNAIILNHGDHAYAKIHFDERSLQNLFKDGLHKFEEPLTRMLILMNIWN